MKNVLFIITLFLSACQGLAADVQVPDAGADADPGLCLYFGSKLTCGVEAGSTARLVKPIPPDVFFVTRDGKLGVTIGLPAITWMSCKSFGSLLFEVYDGVGWQGVQEVQIGDWAYQKDWPGVPLPDEGSFYDDWIKTHPYPDVDSPTYQEAYGRCTP